MQGLGWMENIIPGVIISDARKSIWFFYNVLNSLKIVNPRFDSSTLSISISIDNQSVTI